MSDMSYPTKENTKFTIVQGGEKKVMKKILSVALSTAMAFSMFASVAFGETATTPEAKFTALAAKGILAGYPDGQAHLEKDLTRAEFAKIVAKLLDLKEVTTTLSFKDKNYTASHWARGYIEAVNAAGLMTGKTATTFDPSGKVTVQEVAAVLVRAMKLEVPANAENAAAPWAKGFVQAAINNKLVDANANFKGNATRSLVVNAAYAVDVLQTAPTVVSAEATSATSVLVTFSDKTTATVTPATALVEGTATVVKFKHNGFDYSVTVTLSAPKVVSVNAINAKQLEVKFNVAMKEDSVKDVTAYAIKRAGVSAVSLTSTAGAAQASGELSADGRTLIITLTNALTSGAWNTVAEGDSFNVEIGKLLAANGKEVAAQAVTVKYSDKVAPTFVSVAASGKTATNKVTVTFSEPVDASVATATVNGALVTIGAGSTPNTVVLTSGSNLNVNTTYNVTLLNFKDFGGNLISPNPVNTTVTVSGDTVAPVVAKVEVVRDSLIKLTFDKAMDASTITNATVKVLDPNLTSTNITQVGVTAADSTNKVFNLELSAVPFNTTTNTFSGTLVVSSAVKDAAGNALAATTQSVTLTKDTAAPQIASVTYKKATTYGGQSNTNGFIVVKFNEAVTANAANTAYTVVDNKTGAIIANGISARAVNTSDATELVLSLNAAVATGSTTYTVVIPSGAAKDKSVSANSSAAANQTVDVSAGVPAAADSIAPVLGTVTPTAATLVAGAYTANSIAVTFTEAGTLDAATVLNTNNYRLDGLPLPAGSYISLAGNTATIHLPVNTIAEDKSFTLNVNDIKDMGGNTIAPSVKTGVALLDDVKPTFTAATLNSNGTVSLGFSEGLVTGVGTEGGFTVTVNGSALAGANLAYSIVDGLGSDAGKYVIAVKQSKVTLAAAGGATTITAAGNTYTTSVANGAIEFKFIDVDGDQSYSAGDILISATDKGAVAAVAFAADGTYNLNNATSLTVAAKAAGTTDASTLHNPIVAKSITVK